MGSPSPGDQARRLAAQSLESDDPTGWFERVYSSDMPVPWHQDGPDPHLVQWATGRDGAGRTAVVVGAGLGDDAEFVAGLGFDTLAFDVAPSAVEQARQRFPASKVRYEVADLLNLPGFWRFDLVVENFTVQSLPKELQRRSIAAIAGLVAPGGTLIVHATYRDRQVQRPGPPWPLTEDDLAAFAINGLHPVSVERIPESAVWQAEFTF